MALGQSSTRRIVLKKESSWGVAPGATGGQVIRRTNTTLRLTKETYQSQEKREDFQKADSRHGIRRVTGGLSGELYCGAWEEPLAALLRRDFTAITQIDASAGDGFSITGGAAGGVFTLTRNAYGGESFLTDGMRVGVVFRITGMDASNINRNFLCTAIAADGESLSFMALDRAAVTTEATPDETASVVIPGKVTYIPRTGHTSDSFSIEDYESLIDTSELYRGCVLGAASLQVPATGIATIDFGTVIGKDMDDANGASAPYYTNPTAAGVQRALAAVPGFMLVNGSEVAVATGITINVDLGIEGPAVAFAETVPQVFYGAMANISGSFSAFVENQSYLSLFKNESEVEMSIVLEAPGTAPLDFLNIYMGRVKVNSNDRDDPERGISQNINFESLLRVGDAQYHETSLFIQDSSLS